MENIKELRDLLIEKDNEIALLRMKIEQLERNIVCVDPNSADGRSMVVIDRTQTILKFCSDMYWDFYPDSKLTIYSERYRSISGWNKLIYENFEDIKSLVYEEDREGFIRNINNIIINKKTGFNYEYRYLCADGQYKWLSNRCFGIKDTSGKVICILGLTNDINNIHNQEVILQEERLRNWFLIKTATDYMWEYDIKSGTFTFSEKLLEAMGASDCSSAAKMIPNFLEPCYSMVEEGTMLSCTLQFYNKKSENIIWFEVVYCVLRNVTEEPYKLIGSMRDISEKKLLEQEVQYDLLTKVGSRRAAVEQLSIAYQKFMLTKNNHAVLFMDLDNFKGVNDTYGHLAGDFALQIFAQNLKDFCSIYSGLAFRWGGEEFLAIFEFNTQEKILEMGEELRERVENLIIIWNTTTIKITVSIGISIFEKGDIDFQQVVQRADNAVYKVKANHKNGVIFI